MCSGQGDRGDFGMPGVGSGWIPGATLETNLLKNPGFTAYIEHGGLTIEHPDGKGFQVDATTDDAKYIMDILPTILEHFLVKNAQYARAQTGHDLGAKGIIPDINRKTSALITRFWDKHGEQEVDEDRSEELIDDLIGHLLLMRAKLRTN